MGSAADHGHEGVVRVGPSLRGIRSRAGSSALVFVVAVVAVAGAVAGPVYYSAAQTSIMRDSVAKAPVLGRGLEVAQSGPVAQGATTLSSVVTNLTGPYGHLLQPQILAVEATAFDAADQEAIGLVTRTDVCAHLRVTGSCPRAAGEVIISSSLAQTNGWKTGRLITFAPWGPLKVTGIYIPPKTIGDYWVDQASSYFPYEYPANAGTGLGPAYDAMFTDPLTLVAAPPSAQGSVTVAALLRQGELRGTDVHILQSGIDDLVNDQDLQAMQAVATSQIPNTMSAITHAWSTLEVPLVVITLQLVVLAWLVLFLLVGDAVSARGPDVALAKLRGFTGRRTALFGLSEPTLVVITAFPLGCLVGWAVAVGIGQALLRPGTPTGFPVVAIAAAAAATAAGVAAVVIAAVRTLRRPVLDQWRKTDRGKQGRAWVLDAILLAGSAAGLADLVFGGEIDSAHHSALSLLVPGLLGLAVAVVASRVLPLACRMLARTSAGRGVGAFLALRHVARRPGGARTTILLGTSFALVTFAVSAWAVERSNYDTVAGVTVGAPAVLTVQTPEGTDLGDLVSRADPSGTRAAAVDVFTGSGSTTLAVDPRPWAAVATWPDGTAHKARQYARLLEPSTAPRLVVNGDTVRVTISVGQLGLPGTSAVLDVETPTGEGVTPVQLGDLPQSGDITMSAPLPPCPCTVQDLTFVPDPSLGGAKQFNARLTVRSLEVHDGSGWHSVDAQLTRKGGWRPAGPGAAGETVGAASGGLDAYWSLPADNDAVVAYNDRPFSLPAVAPASTIGHAGKLTASGLDGQDFTVDVLAVAKGVPGLPTGGVVVDRRFAEEAAGGNIARVTQQVWVAPSGEAAGIASRLRAEGVQVLSTQTRDAASAALRRAGPGLAGILFLAEAAAAALLAAAGAVLGLAISARRRRYEMASLEVVGIPARTLSRSVVMEQVIVLGFGVLVGIVTGLAADALVLRVLPEFTSAPPAPVLSYAPPVGLLTAVLVIGAAAVIIVAALAGALLVRGTRLSQLREGAQ